MADTTTRYPEEFKREAVRLYRSGQHGGMAKTAKALGVGHTAMRRSRAPGRHRRR